MKIAATNSAVAYFQQHFLVTRCRLIDLFERYRSRLTRLPAKCFQDAPLLDNPAQ